jgi:hypothetical protein
MVCLTGLLWRFMAGSFARATLSNWYRMKWSMFTLSPSLFQPDNLRAGHPLQCADMCIFGVDQPGAAIDFVMAG